MKIVEVYVSAVDKTYDFRLDENTPLGVLAEEICEMVCQKEKCEIQGDTKNLMFYRNNQNTMLDNGCCLSELGVHTGEKLSLI